MYVQSWEPLGAVAHCPGAGEEEAGFRQKVVYLSARVLLNCWGHDLRTSWTGPSPGTGPGRSPHIPEKKAQEHSSNATSGGTKRGQKQTLERDRYESFLGGLAVLRDRQSPGGMPEYVQWAWRMRDGKRLRV